MVLVLLSVLGLSEQGLFTQQAFGDPLCNLFYLQFALLQVLNTADLLRHKPWPSHRGEADVESAVC